MRGRNYSTEAIVLSRKKFGEADRIITVFTKNYGKMTLLARGVRRTTSRKRGHLETFSYLKLSASAGKGFDVLTEAEIVDNFQEVRANLKKVAVAYFFCEVLVRAINENEPHKDLFDLVVKYLKELKWANSLKKFRLEFTYDLLTNLGFWPKGLTLDDPDEKIQQVVERRLGSIRVGKKLVS